MKNVIFVVLLILLMPLSAKTAAALTATSPIMVEATTDSKPAALSILDQILMSAEPLIVNGVVKANILVNRITKTVEYVWSDIYKCYVRPKYSISNAQSLYNSAHPAAR